jgi:hypothetical protein
MSIHFDRKNLGSFFTTASGHPDFIQLYKAYHITY